VDPGFSPEGFLKFQQGVKHISVCTFIWYRWPSVWGLPSDREIEGSNPTGSVKYERLSLDSF
jgi:hypothetical protein